MEGAAPSLGVTLQVQDIRTADDIPAAFEAASRARAEGALTTEESMFIVHRARVTETRGSIQVAGRISFPAACYRCGWPDGLHGKGSRTSSERRRVRRPDIEGSQGY